jgi:transcriptional regulator of acetoin/glycerol metabolism
MERMIDSLGPFILSPDVWASQTEHSLTIGERPFADLAAKEVSNSWLRCTNEHRVDPHCKAAPQILTLAKSKCTVSRSRA